MAVHTDKDIPITGFQVYYRFPGHGAADSFPAYSLLTWILSAVQWERMNGRKLKLYCDKKTADYLRRSHLDGLWEKIDDQVLDHKISPKIYDCSHFFSLGKFFALLEEKAPCCCVDTDLILWKPVESVIKDRQVVFTHYEAVKPDSKWYHSPDTLHKPVGYGFHPEWDFDVPAANTSFLFFQDEDFKNYYAEEALRFLKNNFLGDVEGIPAELLFAEQWLLPLCIREKGIGKKAGPLVDITWSPAKGRFFIKKHSNEGWAFEKVDNPLVTHTWLAKSAIEQNKSYQAYYCCCLLEKILKDGPQWVEQLSDIPMIRPYLELVKGTSVDGLIKTGKVSDCLYPVHTHPLPPQSQSPQNTYTPAASTTPLL